MLEKKALNSFAILLSSKISTSLTVILLDLSFIFLISSFIMLHVFLASCLYLDIFFWVIVFLNFFLYAFKKIFIWFVFQFSFLRSMFQKNWQTIKTIFFIYTLQGIKSVRFSSKIKSKNQERFSVIYTELATIPKFHRAVGANQK